MQQANAYKHGELGALLRREKLYSNQFAQWRREFAEQGVAGLKKSAPGPASKKSPEQKCVKQLKNENQRLQRQYGSQRRLLNSQKKALELLDSLEESESWPSLQLNLHRMLCLSVGRVMRWRYVVIVCEQRVSVIYSAPP